MAKQKDLIAYNERYRLVYEAGGLFWNHPEPSSFLEDALEHIQPNSRCVEFGCGEGYQCRFIASKGHSALGIDLSPAAIERAKTLTPKDISAQFIIGDITDLSNIRLDKESFDLAVDINCLHMMKETEDRKSYLQAAWNLLKEGGIFYLQNGLDLADVTPGSDKEQKEIEELQRISNNPGGTILARKIVTASGDKLIDLPLCPAGRMQSLQAYIDELRNNGFTEILAKRSHGIDMPYIAVIIAKKTHNNLFKTLRHQ